MEWTNRNSAPAQQAGTPVNHAAPHHSKRRLSILSLRTVSVVLLFCITVLIVAIVWLLALGGAKPEGSYVDKSKLQAVFLNGGQVYFGNISNLNEKYVRLGNIYYLRVNQQVQPDAKTSTSAQNDISLVKLGCELHGPTDEMLINREQVVFWENLKSDGQVAKAVTEFIKQNPNGQKCNTSTSNSTPSSSTPAKQ